MKNNGIPKEGCGKPESQFCQCNLLWFGGLAIGTLLVLFYHPSSAALWSQDANASWFQQMQRSLSSHFFQVWSNTPWLGSRFGPIAPDLNAILLGLVPYPYSPTMVYAVNLFFGGLGFLILLRVMKLDPASCCLGGLAFLLTNTVITLIFPGHAYKIMTSAWLPFSIAAFLLALRDQKFGYHLLAGAFLGLGLLGGEVQICYYLGLWYGAWLVLHLFEMGYAGKITTSHAAKQIGGLILLGAMALVVGASTTSHSVAYLSENRPVSVAVGSEKNWEFATQFFFPPEEILSYITTIQFFGGPHVYWGRDGNPTPLRLSDDYMGLLPLGLALLGGITCWRAWQARLFIVMGLGSLLISFGREGLVYWLLYQLPTMKAQRNPHRWSYFVSLATCVLAAYGINWLLQQLRETAKESRRWSRWQTALLAAGLMGVMLFGTTAVLSFMPEPVGGLWYSMERMNSPQASLYIERTRMVLVSLMRTGFFLSLSAISIFWLIRTNLKQPTFSADQNRGWRPWLPLSIVILVVILDLGMNAKRYIQFHDWRQLLEQRELIGFLKQDKDLYRIKVLGIQQNPLLNQLVTYVLPYHGIPVVDPSSISRIPSDYEKFFAFCNNHYVRSDRYYDFFNIKYVLSEVAFKDPVVKFMPVAQWQGICISRREDYLPRAWLVNNVKVVAENDEEVLSAALHPSLNLRETAVLTAPPLSLPLAGPSLPSTNPNKTDPPGKRLSPDRTPCARMLSYGDNFLEVETETLAPSMLVVGEKWDPDWKAWLNGEPVKIYRVNFLMRGVEVPMGRNRIRMEYRPSLVGFWISAGFVFGLAAFGIGYGIWRWRLRR